MELENTDTGTWEAPAVNAETAAAQMAQVLKTLAQASGSGAGELEHLWVYIDRRAA
jgi:hypothetical protein